MFSSICLLPASRSVRIQWRDRQSVRRALQTDDIQQNAEANANVTTPAQPRDEASIPSHSVDPRSHPLESTEQPAEGRPSTPQFELGGAVAVLMLGALASSLKLTLDSRNGTQPLLPPLQNDKYEAVSVEASHSRPMDQEAHGQQAWWKLDTLFLVTEAPDPRDPTSASPVLIRTAHGEVLPVFQTNSAAAQLVEKLSYWGKAVTVSGAEAPSGNFRVAALQPGALHVQNVPPTVLICEDQLTPTALATPEAWQEVVTAAAPEQLQAWQDHVNASVAPVIPAEASDVAEAVPSAQTAAPVVVEAATSTQPSECDVVSPVSSTQTSVLEIPSPTHAHDSTMETQANSPCQESVPVQAQSAAQGPATPVEEESAWRQSAPHVQSAESEAAVELAEQDVQQDAGSAHVGSAKDTRYSNYWTEPRTRTPASEPTLEDMEPAVYANAEEMEEAERLRLGDKADEQPLRLLSEEETDASLILRDYRSLPVVFAPMLFRGSDVQEMPDDANDAMERMLFTVDTTIDEKDPDVVALVFEDPVDATALLSMLAHVQGFRDPDAVTRRVVPMPVDIATDAADWQGASLLCMAKGFQKKAEVRAGKDIDGLLSRIAGARWASLVDAQMVS